MAKRKGDKHGPPQDRKQLQREAASLAADMSHVEAGPRLHRQIIFEISYRDLKNLDGFVNAWRWVWRKLPLGVRRRMLKYWREMRPVYGDPLYVEIVRDLDVDGRTQGVAKWEGCCILFHGPAIDTMDEAALPVLIAHELAHCFQHSLGMQYESADELEKDAIAIAKRWGFDQAELEVWARLTPGKAYID